MSQKQKEKCVCSAAGRKEKKKEMFNNKKKLSSQPDLRLRFAMEQRQRRLEMEQLLHSENPILPDFKSTTKKKSSTHSKEETHERRNFKKNPRTTHCSASPTINGNSPLYYIVEAVDEAVAVFHEDPENFHLYFTLVLNPLQQQEVPKENSSTTTSTRKNSILVQKDPSLITVELLPIVCDYVNSRLSKFGLQSIAIPTLHFSSAVSGIVTEILLNSWVCSSENETLKLKNLYFASPTTTSAAAENDESRCSSLFGANFTSNDYQRIVSGLNQNRLDAVKKDRRAEIFSQQLSKASSELEWCGSLKQQQARAVKKRTMMVTSSLHHYKKETSIVEVERTRDPVTISEVELQGFFGRLIAMESKRRYRLMQIELDALVPLIVGMKIGAQEIAAKYFTSKEEFYYEEEYYYYEEEKENDDDDDDDDNYVEFS